VLPSTSSITRATSVNDQRVLTTPLATRAQLAERHGDDLPVYRWLERLACSECGARDADFVVAGGEPWT